MCRFRLAKQAKQYRGNKEIRVSRRIGEIRNLPKRKREIIIFLFSLEKNYASRFYYYILWLEIFKLFRSDKFGGTSVNDCKNLLIFLTRSSFLQWTLFLQNSRAGTLLALCIFRCDWTLDLVGFPPCFFVFCFTRDNNLRPRITSPYPMSRFSQQCIFFWDILKRLEFVEIDVAVSLTIEFLSPFDYSIIDLARILKRHVLIEIWDNEIWDCFWKPGTNLGIAIRKEIIMKLRRLVTKLSFEDFIFLSFFKEEGRN